MRSRGLARYVVIAALVVATFALFGCAQSTANGPASPAPRGDASVPVPSYPGTVTTGLNQASLADQGDRVPDFGSAAIKFGASVSFPQSAASSPVLSRWMSKPAEDPQWVLAEYGSGVIIDVLAMPDASSAKRFVEDLDANPGFGPHMQQVEINGVTGRAHEVLDVSASWDASGNAKPGTGVRTGVALVTWAKGRFVTRVMHPTDKVAQLVTIARAVQVQPQP